MQDIHYKFVEQRDFGAICVNFVSAAVLVHTHGPLLSHLGFFSIYGPMIWKAPGVSARGACALRTVHCILYTAHCALSGLSPTAR